jgi:hypothetical protein
VSRRDRQRLDDILNAIDVIRQHLTRGDLSDGLVFDAVRVRLIEIGEAAKALPDELLEQERSIPWHEVAGNARSPGSSLFRHLPRHSAVHCRKRYSRASIRYGSGPAFHDQAPKTGSLVREKPVS